MKTNLILGTIVFLFVGLAAVCGYIVGNESGGESILATTQEFQASLMEADSLLVEARVVMARQDSCLVMCHEQGMYTYNKWRECENQPRQFKSWIEGNHVTLRHWADDYDSVVVIDGILYERAVGSHTAHNNGVGIPFKGVGGR